METGFAVKDNRNIDTFTFTFMHLADAFIQSDLHCIQVTVLHFISSDSCQNVSTVAYIGVLIFSLL